MRYKHWKQAAAENLRQVLDASPDAMHSGPDLEADRQQEIARRAESMFIQRCRRCGDYVQTDYPAPAFAVFCGSCRVELRRADFAMSHGSPWFEERQPMPEELRHRLLCDWASEDRDNKPASPDDIADFLGWVLRLMNCDAHRYSARSGDKRAIERGAEAVFSLFDNLDGAKDFRDIAEEDDIDVYGDEEGADDECG